MDVLLSTVFGTGFAFFMTTAGACSVFLLKNKMNGIYKSIILGIAAGIMLASSIWSLLMPAIEQAESILPVVTGFVLGVAFMIILDEIFFRFFKIKKKNLLLVTSVTIHNIPEGMAIGIAFASAGLNFDNPALFTGAVSLAVGIALQNFPEGAAVALPMKQEGLSTFRSFLCGSMSGIVEPLFGIAVCLAAGKIAAFMPHLLAFASGTMMFVVIEELMPEIHCEKSSRLGSVGVIAGFLLMMILDVVL